jgi:fumarylacetoacetate (FAA) hydrolase family protein
MQMSLALSSLLPADWCSGAFLGRVDAGAGPVPILIADGGVYDLSISAATVTSAIENRCLSPRHGRLMQALDTAQPLLPESWHLLAPIDLQCVKAAGVTFAVSAIERVIEERARGDISLAAAIRARLEQAIGQGIRSVVPGSAQAAELKRLLIHDGMWSQYLEVAIGPDAEIFTKAPVLSSVGAGALIGVRSESAWNNPEPEVVLVVDSGGSVLGATLGNDVNLRDIEGRSALLLGKAKDNNASCAIGPFIRLCDAGFTIADICSAAVDLEISGLDGFHLQGSSQMAEISRDPLEIVRQAMDQHDYPDGFVLFLGTLFAPTQDRDHPGSGFTHKPGDEVHISSMRLGRLTNRVVACDDAPPWIMGIRALMQSLSQRGLCGRL